VLTVVVLAWDQAELTRRCIAAIRGNTDVPYELVIVDNGSAAEGRELARNAADRAVLNEVNLGFSKGMNTGLAVAAGDRIAFVNNDTEVPPGWAAPLLAHLEDPSVGMVVPVVTAASDDRIVRSAPGSGHRRLDPFDTPPPAVLVVLRTTDMRDLGGWDERYPVASGEDLELAYCLWANDLDIVLDERVLVQHVSKGTAGAKLDSWQERWRANRRLFLNRWTSEDLEVPRLPSCSPERHDRGVRTGRAAAGWMRRFFHELDAVGRLGAEVRARRAQHPRERARSALARLRRAAGTPRHSRER
jgi:GT2 family glycosyltransferase